MDKKMCLAAVIGLLVISGIAIATDVTTQGTPNNVAPSVAAPSFQYGTLNPATSFWVSAIITDTNGAADISTSNITCYAPTGTEGTDGWDSIKLANSSLTWTTASTTSMTVNGTFNSSVNYWSTKSANTTWTCRVTADDTAGNSASATGTMAVSPSTGITLAQSTCVFDAANPGVSNKQWTCPNAGTRNQSMTQNGNVEENVTISGTDLTGQTDATWIITVGNLTWNQTTSDVPTTEAGTVLSGSAANFITLWNRGTLATRTYNITNATAWLDYPTPLKSQLYQGTITLTSSAA